MDILIEHRIATYLPHAVQEVDNEVHRPFADLHTRVKPMFFLFRMENQLTGNWGKRGSMVDSSRKACGSRKSLNLKMLTQSSDSNFGI